MKNKIVKKIILSFFTLFLSVIIIETVLRIKSQIKQYRTKEHFLNLTNIDNVSKKNVYRRIHDYIYYDINGCMRFTPNVIGIHRSYDDPKRGILIKINSEGFRGFEVLDVPKKRILFLGDSIVFDGGVSEQDTFIYRLEEFLNNGCNSRKDINIEILNFGITDSGIDQYYLKLKYHGLQFDPDFLFLGFYLNDAVSPQGFMGAHALDFIEKLLESNFMSNFEISSYFEKFYRNIKYSNKKEFKERFRWTSRYNKKEFYRNRDEFIQLIQEANLDWGAAWVPESWVKVKFYLKKIKEICNQSGIKLVVFCFPAEAQVYSDIKWSEFDYPQEQLGIITDKLEIPYFNLLPYLRKYRDRNLFADQCHYKVEGNKVVGDILIELIKKNPNVFSGLYRQFL